MGNSKKAAVPARIKQKASWGIGMIAVNDSSNPDSSTHPINKYSLVDVEEGQAYSVDYLLLKNRTGTEGRTRGELMFINGEFDVASSLVVDAKNLKLFKESGMYPSASEPHVFKEHSDCVLENDLMGRYKKTRLEIDGYSRPTNIIEARLLLNYTGDNPEICDRQVELYSALINALEEKLKYELDSNCVSEEYLKTSSIRFDRYKSFMSRLQRKQQIDINEKIEMPDKVGDIDGMMSEDRDEAA